MDKYDELAQYVAASIEDVYIDRMTRGERGRFYGRRIGVQKIAALLRSVSADERERCVGIVEGYRIPAGSPTFLNSTVENISDAIRGEKENDNE